MPMFQVRFWGVRGSVATAGVDRAGVGGNTSCVEVRCGDELIVLDAGTGLRGLGAELVAAPTPPRVHLLLSHYHWDHIQGFPFFLPAYRPGARIDVYGPGVPARPELTVRELLARQMAGPYFPVGLEAMKAELTGTTVTPGEGFALGAVAVRAAAANHPNGCLAYRIEHGGRAVVYATDTEHDPDAGTPDANLVALARGADVLIYDAQYTPEEHRARRGWGHSTAAAGAAVARAAGVGKLVLFHHDPGHDDWTVARIEAAARAEFSDVEAAREGTRIDLGAPGAAARAA
jgi:phosphoribosyl 1,2-cyclic phosphodiesterase